MKKIVRILTLFQFILTGAHGAADSLRKQVPQKASFKIEINTNVAHPGDTIELYAIYAVGDKKLPPATLDITLENEKGNTWSIRWPMIDGVASGNIVFPKGLPPGVYHAWCGVKPRPLKIYGKVVYCSSKISFLRLDRASLNSMTHFHEIIPLEKDGSFVVENLLFYNTAPIMFSTNRNDVLDIHPELVLDSAYYPASKAYAQILVTENDTVVAVPRQAPAMQPMSWNGPGAFRDLPPGNLYNIYFSSGRFRDTAELLIDLMGREAEIKDKTMGSLLTKEFENFLLKPDIKGTKISFDNIPAAIYWDESPADYATISDLQVSEFSIIKLIPPVQTNGSMTVAFYSKRYPFTNPREAQNKFLLNGYSSETYTLTY